MKPLLHPAATHLVEALQASPNFTTGEPSPDFMTFLHRIETTDPAAFSPDEDEDSLGVSWGHYQFTSGSLTCTRVITTWTDVGSPLYACRLIAAALTTCHVARWLVCKELNPETTILPSFLSDNYLTETTDLLWSCWQAAGGVCHIISISYSLLSTNMLFTQPIMKGKSKSSDEAALERTKAMPEQPVPVGQPEMDTEPANPDLNNNPDSAAQAVVENTKTEQAVFEVGALEANWQL